MTTALFRVTRVGPHVTFQDAGRPGRLRFGIPASGPMDRLAHATGNAALSRGVGADDGAATSIEISNGGLDIECIDGAVTVAVTGGGFVVEHNNVPTDSWGVLTMMAGDRLSVRAGGWGSWAYLAVAGSIEATSWLGHTATHSQSGFGGGAVVVGQEILVTGARASVDRDGPISVPETAPLTDHTRVVLGHQLRHFGPDAADTLLDSPFVLSHAFDRMGVRLDGAVLSLNDALSIPSEPIIRGSIQVAGDGVPTVLHADHQTTGGYPKIATIVSTDLDRFAQYRPGDTVRFEAVTPAEAIDIARSSHQLRSDYLHKASQPTLAQKLMKENLIGWAETDEVVES